MNLRIEQQGKLRRIALASPETRNYLDAAACEKLLDELRDAAADGETGAVLLEADGQVFCTGVDVAAGGDLFHIGRRIVKPIVMAVKGVAISGGLALVANAHVAIAAQGTSFGLTDIREGIWHEPVYRAVAEAIGRRRALELSLTGRVFAAQDALNWGLVHMVAPAIELDDRAASIAAMLANADADAVRTALRRS
jgi:enoyl-CoA hydratase/carnithine racemase